MSRQSVAKATALQAKRARAALRRLRKDQTPAPVYVTDDNLYTLGNGRWTQTIRAFKVSTSSGYGPHHGRTLPQLICAPDAMLIVAEPDTSWNRECGAGVNVATFEWCISAFGNKYDTTARKPLKGLGNYKMWIVEFTRADIACIPRHSQGKFRLYKCKVIKQVTSMRDVPKECR